MRVQNKPMRRWLLVLLAGLLAGMLIAAPVFAQDDEEATEEPAAEVEAQAEEADVEEAAEAEEEGPQGVEVLFLLLGIAAVLVVGGASIGQEAFRKAEADAEKDA